MGKKHEYTANKYSNVHALLASQAKAQRQAIKCDPGNFSVFSEFIRKKMCIIYPGYWLLLLFILYSNKNLFIR